MFPENHSTLRVALILLKKKTYLIFVHRNIDFATQKRLRTIIDKQFRAIVKLKSTKNLQTRTFRIGTATSLYLPCFRGTGVATILGIAGISESIQLCAVHVSY